MCQYRHCKYPKLIETKQMEANLPVSRGQLGNFEQVSLDYAGHFIIKIVDCAKRIKNAKIQTLAKTEIF